MNRVRACGGDRPAPLVARALYLHALIFVSSLLSTSLSADEPAPQEPGRSDLSRYQAVYDRIQKDLASGRRTEEADRLAAVLFGSLNDPQSAWYGPGRSRYDWVWLAARFDVDRDGRVEREEFPGPDRTWARIDRDRDGVATAADMDWSPGSEGSRKELEAWRQFLAMDGNGDGELTTEEWAAYFGRRGGGRDRVDFEGFRALLDPSAGGARPGRSEGPARRAQRIEGVLSGDLGMLGVGPEVGSEAPDFTLRPRDGGPPVTLASFRGARPVVLSFGSYTCPPYRGMFRGVERLHADHGDRVAFLGIYIREAHPTDGLVNPANERLGIEVKQPTSLEERLAVAGTFCEVVRPGFPVLIDTMDDRVGRLYQGSPNRLYLIDREGRIAYKSGQGPRGFKPEELGQAIELMLFDEDARGGHTTAPGRP